MDEQKIPHAAGCDDVPYSQMHTIISTTYVQVPKCVRAQDGWTVYTQPTSAFAFVSPNRLEDQTTINYMSVDAPRIINQTVATIVCAFFIGDKQCKPDWTPIGSHCVSKWKITVSDGKAENLQLSWLSAS